MRLQNWEETSGKATMERLEDITGSEQGTNVKLARRCKWASLIGKLGLAVACIPRVVPHRQ